MKLLLTNFFGLVLVILGAAASSALSTSVSGASSSARHLATANFIGIEDSNAIQGDAHSSVIVGGQDIEVSSNYISVGGGHLHHVRGQYGTVPGGVDNTISNSAVGSVNIGNHGYNTHRASVLVSAANVTLPVSERQGPPTRQCHSKEDESVHLCAPVGGVHVTGSLLVGDVDVEDNFRSIGNLQSETSDLLDALNSKVEDLTSMVKELQGKIAKMEKGQVEDDTKKSSGNSNAVGYLFFTLSAGLALVLGEARV